MAWPRQPLPYGRGSLGKEPHDGDDDGGGVGWALAIILIAGLRQKMKYSNIPQPFEGVAVIMIITGVMAMTFMGFAGMVSIQ